MSDAVEEEEVVRALVYEQTVPRFVGLGELIHVPIPEIYERANSRGSKLVPFPADLISRNLLAARVRLERLIAGDYAVMSDRLREIQALIGGSIWKRDVSARPNGPRSCPCRF